MQKGFHMKWLWSMVRQWEDRRKSEEHAEEEELKAGDFFVPDLGQEGGY